MKRRGSVMCAVIASTLLLGGCAGISHGIKVYPQKIYLLVDKEKGVSKLLSLPDVKNGYELKPWSFLSKHDFTLKIEEAQVKEVTSNQDSTAALALLQKIVEVGGQLATEALKAAAPVAGKAVASVDLVSSFGLATGIYELDESGRFNRVSP
jgi:hypothetical protein